MPPKSRKGMKYAKPYKQRVTTQAMLDAAAKRRKHPVAATIADRDAAAQAQRERHADDERTKTYREEKAAWLVRRQPLLADAKAQYQRQLARDAEPRRGGRPKRLELRRDPADALIVALEHGE